MFTLNLRVTCFVATHEFEMTNKVLTCQ